MHEGNTMNESETQEQEVETPPVELGTQAFRAKVVGTSAPPEDENGTG